MSTLTVAEIPAKYYELKSHSFFCSQVLTSLLTLGLYKKKKIREENVQIMPLWHIFQDRMNSEREIMCRNTRSLKCRVSLPPLSLTDTPTHTHRSDIQGASS